MMKRTLTGLISSCPGSQIWEMGVARWWLTLGLLLVGSAAEVIELLSDDSAVNPPPVMDEVKAGEPSFLGHPNLVEAPPMNAMNSKSITADCTRRAHG